MNTSRSNTFALSIIGLFFFIFGFVTWLNSVLIPFLKTACELTLSQAFWVTFAFYISYFFMAFPSSYVLKWTGFRKGMPLGLAIMALGSLLFIPAAYSRQYPLFLIGLFLQGTGLTILQTASNPYVTILGPIESAAKRISIMGVANKVAGMIGPLVLGAIILSGSGDFDTITAMADGPEKASILDTLALKVVIPYAIMAGVLILLAALVFFTPLPDVEGENEPDNNQGRNTLPMYLILGVLAIFLYVGVEVIAGDSIIIFGQSLNLAPIPIQLFGWEINLAHPGNFTSYVMFGMVLGYLVGIATIPKIISQAKALALFSLLGIIFSVLAILTNGFTSIIFIALLGFANAIMWPAIWPLSIEKLGRRTKLGSALLIMGIAGGATMPLIFSSLGEMITMQNAYIILLPAYLYILFFAIKGHKIGKA
ncbi:MAG: glucose/galactose MFS transporter [Marinilabiliales bacterium]|nr:MAG: glucose/galactose MFS transporter [Marinilabiliales bacterium]